MPLIFSLVLKALILFTMLYSLSACTGPQSLRLYSGPSIGLKNEANLILPVEFEILQLDGQTVSGNKQIFRNQPLNIQLTPGFHTLILKYSNTWQLDADNHDTLSTGNLVFEITMQAQESFNIKTPDIHLYEHAQNFIISPKVHLYSQQQSVLGSHIKKENPLILKSEDKSEVVKYPNLKQLKFWWKQASHYEKSKFIIWKESK